MIIQVVMEVPAVETKTARDTQVTAIKNGFDAVMPSLSRIIRALPVQMTLQRNVPDLPPIVTEKDYPQPKRPIACNPEDWECGVCGGKAAAETVGMFTGRRWVHTCGESLNDRRDKETPNG